MSLAYLAAVFSALVGDLLAGTVAGAATMPL